MTKYYLNRIWFDNVIERIERVIFFYVSARTEVACAVLGIGATA